MTSSDVADRLELRTSHTRSLDADWQLERIGSDRPTVRVDLPHDAMITEPRQEEGENGPRTGYFPGGRYRYTREFDLTEEEAGQCVALRFEGVYQRCVVTVNGRMVARHAYGYTEFDVELAGVAKPGHNRVEVEVDNSQEPNSRWYSGSGIYRPVSLLIRPHRHLTELRITTCSLEPAVIRVEAQLSDGSDASDAVVSVFDRDQLVAHGPLGELTIPDCTPWSAENPHLYRCVVSIPGNREETAFGVRTLDWSPRTGLRVNGTETKLRGACIHHDNGILGAAAFADAEERKIRILKESGYNAIRSAHNPCSRALLAACDRLGMYVMDEFADQWYTPKSYHDYARDFAADHVADLTSMVTRDYNHPSVIMYSIGNEVSEPAEQRGTDLAGELAALVRRLDPTRPVTCGINVMIIARDMGMKETVAYNPDARTPADIKDPSGQMAKASGSTLYNLMVARLGRMMALIVKGRKNGEKIAELAAHLDVAGYNYAETRYDEDVKAHPDRIIVGTETFVAQIHHNWAKVLAYPQLIGDFVWTGWDYLGEIGLGHWEYSDETGLRVAAGGGTIDLIGNREAQNYYQQIVWGTYRQPWIGVRPLSHAGQKVKKAIWRFTDAVGSWTWPGCEGRMAQIEVYAQADRVVLTLDGRRIGAGRLRRCRASFRAAYAPGVLEAVAYAAGGRELGRTRLGTAGPETVLTVSPEKTELRANGQDLCFVPIAITDAAGVVKAGADQQVTVSIDGSAARLIALGSGSPRPESLYDGDTTKTWYGRALAVVRAGHETGAATVRVSAPGLAPQEFRIAVIPASTTAAEHS